MPFIKDSNGQVVYVGPDGQPVKPRPASQGGGGKNPLVAGIGSGLITGAGHGVRGALAGSPTITSGGSFTAGPVGSAGYNAAVSGTPAATTTAATSGGASTTTGGAAASSGPAAGGAGALSTVGPPVGVVLGAIGQGYTANDLKDRFSDGEISSQDIEHASLVSSDDGRLGTYGGLNLAAGEPIKNKNLDAAAGYSQAATPTASAAAASNAAAASSISSASAFGPQAAFLAAAANVLGVDIKSGKHKDQRKRDWVRDNAKDFGLVDENYMLDLPNGQKFNFGSEKLRDAAGNVIEGAVPNDRAYNIRWDENTDNDLIGALNPIAFVASGGDSELYTQVVGQLYNAAEQSGDKQAFVNSLYSKFDEKGIGRDQFAAAITDWAAEGKIDEHTRDAFISGVDVNTRPQAGKNSVSYQGHYKAPQPAAAAPTPSTAPVTQPRVAPKDRLEGASRKVDPRVSGVARALARRGM